MIGCDTCRVGMVMARGEAMSHRRIFACITGLAMILCIGSAEAQSGPSISRAEAAQLYAAGGFPIVKNQPNDACGAPAKPTITFLDLNADRKPEALFIDRGPCYLPDKTWFSIAAKGTDGRWRLLVGQNGTVRALATKTGDWIDLEWSHGGRTQPLRFDGVGYVVPSGKSVKPAPPPAKPAATSAPAAASGDAAIFRAAGFTRRGNQWRSDCDDPGTLSYGPGTIESRSDLNGDGRPEAVVTEGGIYCYGNTGTAYWLVSQQADGSWKLITNNTGIPEFLKTRGVGGWPDILVGGPGFCFPVERWNGKAYVLNRREYNGKPCK